MKINNKKNQLSRVIVFFIMFLFAMCLTMNALLCSTFNFCELSANENVIELFSESIIANGDDDNATYFKAPFFEQKNTNNETITKNICATPMNISKGISLLLFLIIALLFFCLTLFVLLPDEWTLINHKVRLDN